MTDSMDKDGLLFIGKVSRTYKPKREDYGEMKGSRYA